MSPARKQNRLSRNVTWSVGLVAVFAVALAGLVLLVDDDGRADATTATGGAAATVRSDSHVLSEAPDGAPVLVEFLDFECEACRAWFPVVEASREEFDGRVQFVARYFPLPGHASSVDAALAVEASAQQGRFHDMYALMYETQSQWGEQPSSQAPVFRGFAEDLGLDMTRFDDAVADPATRERVERDVADGIELGVQGTPTFFLDGRKIEPQSPDELRALLEAALDD